MYSIYKGYYFPISIISNVKLDISQSRLYNAPTKSSCALTLMAEFTTTYNSTKKKYEYQIAIPPEHTALLPVGVYSLELRTATSSGTESPTAEGYMAEFIPQFAKVVDTAYVNVEQESSSSD